MDARASIVAALDKRDAAGEAVATAEAVYAVAVAQSENADQRVAAIAAIEEQAAGDFANRIRAAVATGGKLHPTKPSADAIARHTAEADARAARAAVTLLTKELSDAKAALEAAQLGVRLAEHDACAAVASAIVERMQIAYEVLAEGHRHLSALMDVALTPLPMPATPLEPWEAPPGAKRIALDDRGRKLMQIDLGPQSYRSITPYERGTLIELWRDWRNSLAANPDFPPPWGDHA